MRRRRLGRVTDRGGGDVFELLGQCDQTQAFDGKVLLEANARGR